MGFLTSLYTLVTSKMSHSHNGSYRSPSRSKPEGHPDNYDRELSYENHSRSKYEAPYDNYSRGSHNYTRSKSDGGIEPQGRGYSEGSYGPYDPGIADGQYRTSNDQRQRREKRDDIPRSPRRSSEPRGQQGPITSGRQRREIGSSAPDLAVSGSPPYNFSWVEPGRICGSAWPQTLANVTFLKSEGVGHIVTLSREKRPPAGTTELGVQCHLIEVAEFLAPTMKQIDNFIGICDWSRSAGVGVCVHCRMGRGRTGTMLACYLVKFYSKSPQEAIAKIRQLRPYSIETREQEYAVEDYYEYIRRDPQSFKGQNNHSAPEKYIFPSDI